MRILVYDVAASSGGALSILTDFYRQVRKYGEGHEWHFVVSTPQFEETENVRVHRYPEIKKSPLNRILFDSFTIRRLVREWKIERILSLQNVCVSGTRVPQIISLHNALPFHKCDATVLSGRLAVWKQRYLNRKIRASLRKAEMLLVPNEWIFNSCASVRGVKREKMRLLPPNLELPAAADRENAALDAPEIAFFYPANAEPYKRHDLICRACARLKAAGYGDYRVVLTVRGTENAYIAGWKKTCEEGALPVDFRGALPRDEVYRAYFQSVLLFPSEIETDALPILEAMACNGFIVATETDFASCILKDYPNRVLVPVGDDAALADAMRDVLDRKYQIKESDRASLAMIAPDDAFVKAVTGRMP